MIFPPPEATRADIDRFMLPHTHHVAEVVRSPDDWMDGTWATDEELWPARFGIVVIDAQDRMVRTLKGMRRTIDEGAFPVAVWRPNGERWFSFAGQNCHGPCRGWDGKSGRCDCGNRRVYWDTSQGRRCARAD